MKLATAAEVLARGNVSNTVASSSTQAVESALEAATTMAASILQTPLESVERIDYFDYLPSKYETFTGMSLRLRQRFVEGTPKLYYATDGLPLTALTTDNQRASTDMLVNRERGVIDLMATPPKGYRSIAVKYAAGFTEGSSDIPSWLREAAISACLHVHHAQAIAHNKDDQPDMSKVMAGILYTQINQHIMVEYDAVPSTDSVLL